MRRTLLLLLVLATLVTGCANAATAATGAARETIAEGDALLGRGKYDEAVDAYIVAASKAKDRSELHDEALRKASVAVSRKVEKQPLTVQLTAMKTLLQRSRQTFLPLYGHNWLCERLDGNARFALEQARVAVKANETLMASAPKSSKTAKKTTRKTAVKTKTAAKVTATKAAAKKSATATASAVATPVVVAVVATVSPSGDAALVSAAEYKQISRAVVALGQPASREKLYLALAELRAAMDASEKARGTGAAPTYRQAVTLRAVNGRLNRAISAVSAILESKD